MRVSYSYMNLYQNIFRLDYSRVSVASRSELNEIMQVSISVIEKKKR